MTQQEYNWFIGNLANPQNIARIRIELKIRYSENYTNPERYNYKYMNISISFSEDSTRIMVNSEQLENESYTIYNDIMDILNRTISLPEVLKTLLSNKFIIIIGQWFISAIIGNVISYNIIANWYKYLIPKTKYAGWNKSKHRATYIDNVDELY